MFADAEECRHPADNTIGFGRQIEITDARSGGLDGGKVRHGTAEFGQEWQRVITADRKARLDRRPGVAGIQCQNHSGDDAVILGRVTDLADDGGKSFVMIGDRFQDRLGKCPRLRRQFGDIQFWLVQPNRQCLPG